MKPSRSDEDAVVDLLDVILEEGVVLQADVIISVADIPLVGLQLRAALAGLDTMTDYGLLTDWDAAHRELARERDETPSTSSAASGEFARDTERGSEDATTREEREGEDESF
jgi:hypothetical protein